MKKIIKGKLYNTDTAKLVGEWGNGHTGFSYCHEDLYLKRTGEFFLYGRGGAASKYAEAVDQNTWSGGSDIVPMSYDEAQKWAEEHLDADEYEEIFEPIPEDESDEFVQMKFYLRAGTADAIRRMSREKGVLPSALAETLLTKALDDLK